jgi:hypothetical protein
MVVDGSKKSFLVQVMVEGNVPGLARGKDVGVGAALWRLTAPPLCFGAFWPPPPSSSTVRAGSVYTYYTHIKYIGLHTAAASQGGSSVDLSVFPLRASPDSQRVVCTVPR